MIGNADFFATSRIQNFKIVLVAYGWEQTNLVNNHAHPRENFWPAIKT